MLTALEVVRIATTLAGWGALVTRSDLYVLLDLMDVPRHVVPAAAWSATPLDRLRDGRPAAVSTGDAAAAQPAEPAQPAEAEQPAEPARAAEAAHPTAESAARPRIAAAALPAPATELIGRERERAQVAAAVMESRLVTLTGVGGTGKTRLALQLARDLACTFADGVAFIDLAPVRDPALLATATARALGLAPTSAQAAETYLTEALRDRELLLVADNLEHLLDETPLLSRLLAAAPALRVLATSRIPLGLYGEYTVRVPPLPLPERGDAGPADSEAVQLFIERARAVSARFNPDADEMTAVAEICAALDGLPLAIELAAARVRLYRPRALLGLLRSRLAVLTDGPRDLPHRQRTLRATLDWSHALLAPDAGRLFARLGVFAGPFDADAAAAVSAEPDPGRMLEYLVDLADQGLLEVTAGDRPRFRMLQTVREYALARLAEARELDMMRRRHLAHFLTVTVTARRGMEGPRQAELIDALEATYPNLRAGLEFAWHHGERDHACLDQGLRLAAALSLLWQRRGPLAEGVLHLDRLLGLDDALGRPSPAQVRAAAVLTAGTLACFIGDYPRTAELARHAVELCEPLGDELGLAVAYRLQGEAALAVGDYGTAGTHFRRQLDQASQAADLRWQADAYNMLGEIAQYRGDYRGAQSLVWRALKLFQQAGNPDNAAVMLSSLGEAARDAGRPLAARRLFSAALRRHAELGNKRHIAYELEGLSAAAALEGDSRLALLYLGAAQALREEIGGPQPPAEQAILGRILAPARAALSAAQQREALSQGRSQPLAATIAHALGQVPSPRPAPESRALQASADG